MSDLPNEGAADTVAVDNADTAHEDRGYDTLEDAAQALGDDDEGDDEVEAGDESEETDAPGEDGPEDEAPAPEKDADKLRMQDYTRKTQALSDERRVFEQQREETHTFARNVNAIAQRLQSFAAALIPDEIRWSPEYDANPGAYFRDVQNRNDAIAEVQQLLAVAGELDTAAEGYSEADMARFRDNEAALLVKAMPELRDPARKAQFDAAVMETAKAFGFSEEEIGQTVDHRMLQVVHYARIGKRAEENRKNAARRTAQAPNTGSEGRAAPPRDRNAEAMRRLARSGSIDDAARALSS